MSLLFDQLVTVGTVIFVFMTVLFLISLIIKRNDIADVAWGTGIWLVAAVSYFLTAFPSMTHTVMFILVTLWAVRLTVRIGLRNMKKGEDPRYTQWRESWGTWFVLRSYLQVFLLQGSLMVVVGYPLIHMSVYGTFIAGGPLVYAGIVLWALGFFFEVVGDHQLDRFIARKKRGETEKKIMDEGLWRYTRHPSYFGEVTMWWSIWLMTAAFPLSYIALISPLMITFLILKVSGIPMLERQFAGDPEWEAYAARTSTFFPLPPQQ